MRLKHTGASAALAAVVAIPLVAGCSSATTHKTSTNAGKPVTPAAAPAAAVTSTSPGGALKPADMSSLVESTGTQANVAAQTGASNLPLSASASSGPAPAVASKAKAKTRTVWLKIKAQPQQKTDWCIPAASRAMISHRYKKVPSQTTLAKYMKTGKNSDHWGTSWPDVVPGLNKFTHRHVYTWAHFTSVQSYFNGMAYETDTKNTPTVGAFDFQKLPWRNIGGKLSGHAVVVTGYYYNWKTHAGSLHFWDPWQNTGYHAASPFTAFADAKIFDTRGAFTVGIYG